MSSDDRLLEVGCGGGLLLRDALDRSRATAIDHSHELAGTPPRLSRSPATAISMTTATVRGSPISS
jgi:2-polyprenyl-3-methyl-5-hydroxy-6-metoxy-1,4-benzoquinol methylase